MRRSTGRFPRPLDPLLREGRLLRARGRRKQKAPHKLRGLLFGCDLARPAVTWLMPVLPGRRHRPPQGKQQHQQARQDEQARHIQEGRINAHGPVDAARDEGRDGGEDEPGG